MADVFTKEKRSEIMSKIRSKSGLEHLFCRVLSTVVYPLGLRYRKNYKIVPGCPDIAFVSKKVAIFIDGSFWHGYNYKTIGAKLPKKYWRKKIEENIKRDKRKRSALRKLGWKVVRIWEHEFRKNPTKSLNKVKKALDLQ